MALPRIKATPQAPAAQLAKLPKFEQLLASRSEAAREAWRRVDEALEEWRRSLIRALAGSEPGGAAPAGAAGPVTSTVTVIRSEQGPSLDMAQLNALLDQISARLTQLESQISALQRAALQLGQAPVFKSRIGELWRQVRFRINPDGVPELETPEIDRVQARIPEPSTVRAANGERRLLAVLRDPDGQPSLHLSEASVGPDDALVQAEDGALRPLYSDLNPDGVEELRLGDEIATPVSVAIRQLRKDVRSVVGSDWLLMRHDHTGQLYTAAVVQAEEGELELVPVPIETLEQRPLGKPYLDGPTGPVKLEITSSPEGEPELSLSPAQTEDFRPYIMLGDQKWYIGVRFNEEGEDELYIVSE